MQRNAPKLPYLARLFPIPHLWLMGKVIHPGEVGDTAAGFFLLFETVFVLLVLALLKISWIRLRFKWVGLGLLLIATTTLFLLPGNVAFTRVLFGGWVALLILSGAWLYSQRAYLD
ncbi:hypothetical protein [Armatimonas sp.]|uniref:hypothetical protein n=1 Tax=Armatimonas sp. TaxID=1872638 RepID=UPI003751858B